MAQSASNAREKSGGFLQDGTLRPEPGDLFLQSRNPGQIGPHLPVPGKRNRRRGCQLSRPPPQHALRNLKVTGRLCNSDTPVRHQPHSLNFKLEAELPSRHIHSPVPWSRSYLRVHETGSSSESFLGLIDIACIRLWLRHLSA